MRALDQQSLRCLLTTVLAIVLGSSAPVAGPPPAAAPSQASLDDFDFADGIAYPARAKVRIGDVAVPPGASEVHVPIILDRPTPNTVAVRVVTRNGSGLGYGYEEKHFTKVDRWVFFRPGDPLVQTVRVLVRNIDAGRHFDLIFPSGVVGGENADGRGKITGVVGAAASQPRTGGFRKPRTFTPTGRLVYRLDPAQAKWTDGGSTTAWSTRLPHGRSQPANDETGLYLDPDRHRASQPPIAVENGALLLRSQQLASGIEYDGTIWKHGASVLTGEKMAATHIRYGQYEWEATMPNRRGAWPALWLLPTNGWPPEIDIYEGFGYSPDFDFARHISGNLHGGSKGKRRFVVPMRMDAKGAYGIDGFDSSFHRFAVDIAPDFITWFVDGDEVFQAVNPFSGTMWFPLMTVAVKHKGDYRGGTGAMRVRAFAVWQASDGEGGD